MNTQLAQGLKCAALILVASSTALGADSLVTGWKKALSVDVTTTQTAYSDAWVGGEAGSLNWAANLNGAAERQFSGSVNYRSTLKLSFGQTMTQDEKTRDWSKPRKSTDLIDWENVARFTLEKFFDPYAAFRLESQFFTPLSDSQKVYLSPLKLTESAGLAKRLYVKDKDQILSRLGFAAQQIFTKSSDTAAATRGKIHDSTFTYGGIESVSEANLTLGQRVHYVGKIGLYKALFFSRKNDVRGTSREDDWKAIDVNWENIVSVGVSKVMTVNLYTQLLYDKEISAKGRFKETLALGLVFKMI